MIRRPPRSTLFSLHDALPISPGFPRCSATAPARTERSARDPPVRRGRPSAISRQYTERSEEHTSELQSQSNLVCRLLLEKKNAEINALGVKFLDEQPLEQG